MCEVVQIHEGTNLHKINCIFNFANILVYIACAHHKAICLQCIPHLFNFKFSILKSIVLHHLWLDNFWTINSKHQEDHKIQTLYTTKQNQNTIRNIQRDLNMHSLETNTVKWIFTQIKTERYIYILQKKKFTSKNNNGKNQKCPCAAPASIIHRFARKDSFKGYYAAYRLTLTGYCKNYR